MLPCRPGLIAALLLGGLMLSPDAVRGVQGRYTGSVTRFEGEDPVSSTLHNYDVSTLKSLSNTVTLNMRLSLQYQARLDQSNSELLGSRVHGDLRGTIWRLRGQIAPWQDATAGPQSPRNRSTQLGFNLAPRNLPHLDLTWNRGDGESPAGRSVTEDRRANVSWSRGILQASGGYRSVDRELRESSAPSARTEEWKTQIAAAKNWRGLALRSAYEFLSTQYRSAARLRDADAHTLDLGAGWNPLRTVNVGGNALIRRGSTDDNALPAARNIDEQSYGARLGFRPWSSLDLQASRDYRRTQVTGGNEISDYARLSTTFRKPLIRRIAFQTGYQKNIDLTHGGPVPADNIYAQVDGPLRRGLYARQELRTSTSGGSPGRQWRRITQLRGDPLPEVHVEASWRHDALPDSAAGQTQNEWSTTIGFAPESSLGLTANARWQRNTGRVESTERLANLLLTWRSSERSQLSFNWSRRTSITALLETQETVFGFDLQMWLPGDYRVSGSAREVRRQTQPDNRTWSLAVEKSF